MNENQNGNGNGTGGDSSRIARLTERSYAQQATIESMQTQIAALESVVIERSGIRSWLPIAGIITAGAFAIFIFGIEPLKDKDDILLKEIHYVRDDAEKQRAVIWDLSQKEHAKMLEWLGKLDEQRDARLLNLESQHFRESK